MILGQLLVDKHQKKILDKAQLPAAKPYAPPVLKEFGPVGALTQAGTGNAIEMAMGNNSRKMA
jgi:hypothetical protein